MGKLKQSLPRKINSILFCKNGHHGKYFPSFFQLCNNKSNLKSFLYEKVFLIFLCVYFDLCQEMKPIILESDFSTIFLCFSGKVKSLLLKCRRDFLQTVHTLYDYFIYSNFYLRFLRLEIQFYKIPTLSQQPPKKQHMS
jgi:hypothetical protein